MPTVTYDQPGATYDQPLFVYDQDTASPFPVPPAPASLVGTDGWLFEAISPSGVRTAFHPEITATLSNDASRETRRIADGIVLVPSEAAKVDLVADLVEIYLRVDGVSHPMGIYRFTEDSLAEDAVTDDTGAPADLVYASLGDQFARLRASDEVARLALAGTDPSQVMIDVLAAAGLPHSIAGSIAPFAVDVVWAAGTTLEAIVSQCAEVAGHRRPWMDNTGVIRSVAANVLETEVIPLTDLGPLAGSTVITNTRLFSPNRIVVVDDTAASPTTGTWDAPASAPNSAVHRGWTQTEIITQQGLSGAAHAQAVAATLGEAAGARKLAAVIRPTWRLDGPVILAHRSAYWMVTAWSISLEVGATMSVDAVEILLDRPAPGGPVGAASPGPPAPPPPALTGTVTLSGEGTLSGTGVPSSILLFANLSDAAPYTPPTTIRGPFAVASSATAYALRTTRPSPGARIDGGPYYIFGGTICATRWVSDAFTAAGTISGATVSWCIGVLTAAATGGTLYTRLYMYVTTGNTDTPRGTLLSFPTGSNAWAFSPEGRAETGIALNTLAVQAGDHLVIEFGWEWVPGSGVGNGWIYAGSGGTDLTEGATASTTGPASWFEFTGLTGIL